MKIFEKIVNHSKLRTVLAKNFIIDVQQGPKYASSNRWTFDHILKKLRLKL